jgi:hypothetical protein
MVELRRIDLGFRPRPWQDQVLRNLKRFSSIVVHRRGGKTVLAIMKLIDGALKHDPLDRGRYNYVGPFRAQAKAIAWDYLKHYAMKVPDTIVNEGELWVEFPNKARVRIFGADNPDSLRGLYHDGIVIDESADIKPNVWGEIIRPALADRGGWALFIGTPKGINLFSEIHFAAEKSDEWYASIWRWQDTGVLPYTEIERMRGTMSIHQFRQEMECDFGASVENQMIDFELVNQAAGKHLQPDVYEGAGKVLGVDVARYGDDSCVMIQRQGLRADAPTITPNVDNMEYAGIVAKRIDIWQPDAVFIDLGRGEGVHDRLKQLGFSQVMGVNFGGSATNPDAFQNKRVEMWFDMKNWLLEGGAIPDHVKLKQDLCTPLYTYKNARGRMQLESKDDIRKRGLPSPDCGDALALTFASPVAPRAVGMEIAKAQLVGNRSTVAEYKYDPWHSVE